MTNADIAQGDEQLLYALHLQDLLFSILELYPTDEDTYFPAVFAATAYCNFQMFLDELGELEAFFRRPWQTVN